MLKWINSKWHVLFYTKNDAYFKSTVIRLKGYNQSLSIKLKAPPDWFKFVFLGPGRYKILFAILNPSYYLTVLIPHQYKNMLRQIKIYVLNFITSFKAWFYKT